MTDDEGMTNDAREADRALIQHPVCRIWEFLRMRAITRRAMGAK